MNNPREKTKIWHVPDLHDLELMRATFISQTFPRHTHEGFAIGVIEQGALRSYYRGGNYTASPGTISLVNPDEAHTGGPASDGGWTYRMFYLAPGLLQKASSLINGRTTQMPFFQMGVIHDNELASMIYNLHANVENRRFSLLEMETRLLELLTIWIIRYADDPPIEKPVGKEHHSIKTACEFIHSCFAENISIQHLADIACLSPYHFIRVFKNRVGVPPHVYLTQVRINKAKELLLKQQDIADVALETGFTDQSHFSRHFKRYTGATPGTYRNIVQYN